MYRFHSFLPGEHACNHPASRRWYGRTGLLIPRVLLQPDAYRSCCHVDCGGPRCLLCLRTAVSSRFTLPNVTGADDFSFPSFDEIATDEGMLKVLVNANSRSIGCVGPRTVRPVCHRHHDGTGMLHVLTNLGGGGVVLFSGQVPHFFKPVEIKTIQWARTLGVGSYNDFRVMIGLPRQTGWDWCVQPACAQPIR